MVDSNQVKPKMVYFMASTDNYPPTQIVPLVQRVLNGLSEFFELVVISQDSDYAEICETHHPDITMFDGGLEMLPSRVRVTNTSAFPEIPKIGFVKVDAHSYTRSVFLSDMEQWGIETFFTYDTAWAENNPEFADQLFYWPFFVDTGIFRDYGQNKVIPLLFTGNCDGPSIEYQWRIKIKSLASKRYPSLVVPHPGYNKRGGPTPTFKFYGEQYARLLNSSLIAPTCGGMAKLVVMKHLEITASRACLVTERTPAVEAFGFVDLENCIFADENDVIDKLDYLFTNRDVLEQITSNGYGLVHSRHTAKQRPQLLQWLQLHKSLKPGQRIVQTGFFDDLTIVEERSEIKTLHIINGLANKVLVEQGDEKLLAGEYREAKKLYSRCFDYLDWMPEPKLRLALCELYEGDEGAALEWISQLIEPVLGKYEAARPDPVEWAYLLIALLCQGDLEDSLRFSRYFSSLHHPELLRARWAVLVLCNKLEDAKCLISQMSEQTPRKSIHQLPKFSFEEYVRRLSMMLKACRKRRFARTVLAAIKTPHADAKRRAREPSHKNSVRLPADKSDAVSDVSYLLESLNRRREMRRPKLGAKLKSQAPLMAQRINELISRHPGVKAKIKTAAIGYLKIQDW